MCCSYRRQTVVGSSVAIAVTLQLRCSDLFRNNS
jgi:hypothetical protein